MLVGVTMLALKTARREILPHGRQRVGRVRRASPDRIREKRAAVRNVASAQLVYIGNNPLAGKDPTGYVACGEVSAHQTDTSGSCDYTQNGQTTSVSYSS